MKLTFEPMNIAISEPFVSHKGVTEVVRHILVRIEWDGRTGHGVAVPAKEYTTAAAVRAALSAYAEILEGQAPTQLEQLLRRAGAAAPGQPAALSAVDMAMHDLLGQHAGLSLHELLGLRGLALPPTATTLGKGPLDASVAKAQRLAAWPILKLKMSAPDEELVRRVRAVYPGRLWIDGNGAWSPKQAVVAAERFHRLGVELIEQPVAAGALADLRFVRERVPVVIIADEDCAGPADVQRLAGCADGINLKLLKCGGVRRALETIRLARHCGLEVMLGCKTESALGVTAIAHLGGLADYLDLDGHLDLRDDPFHGLTVDHGTITLPAGPGLGVTSRGAERGPSTRAEPP